MSNLLYKDTVYIYIVLQYKTISIWKVKHKRVLSLTSIIMFTYKRAVICSNQTDAIVYIPTSNYYVQLI